MADEAVQKKELRIRALCEGARQDYSDRWHNLIREWQSRTCQDTAWLTYSANYLFHTAGVRWALDPYSLVSRVGGAAQPDFARDLAPLQVVLLSHLHNDHFDRNLIAAVSSLPLTWIVPEFMLEEFSKIVNRKDLKLVVPKPGITQRVSGLAITPFESLHVRNDTGVPEYGYLVEFNQRKWLLPGDVRSYDLSKVPVFGKIQGAFAHLWLGKGEAMHKRCTLLEDFCEFFGGLRPQRIVVTHLEEYGRDSADFWDETHYNTVRDYFQEHHPQIRLTCARMGQRVDL